MRRDGLAAVLDGVRDDVIARVAERLRERRAQGRHDLPDEEIDSIARIAGIAARNAAADGIADAYQSGVNAGVPIETHDRPTRPTPPPEGTR